MAELEKMNRVIRREWPEAQCEVLLVLDATTGQNAIIQAKLFMQSVPLTGIVLTKLDGTAKGGVVISVKRELDIPVRFIGIGEGADDLQPFNAESFAEAIL
jgi:fused signal recognition particle receptor